MAETLLAKGTKKRKRDSAHQVQKSRKAAKVDGGELDKQILEWEEQLLESQHSSNINKLREVVDQYEKQPKSATLAAVALCRVFCRYVASDQLLKSYSQSAEEAESTISLRRQLRDYTTSIGRWIGSPIAAKENTALTLLMRIVKDEVQQESKRAEQAWQHPTSTFITLLRLLLEKDGAEGARQNFVERYVEEHDDVRYYTLRAIKQIFADETFQSEARVDNTLELLAQIEGVPDSAEQLQDWFGQTPAAKHNLLSLSAHRKVAQEAWLACFRSRLTENQRRKILNIIDSGVLPWFSNRLEILADFLTDSFNTSGSTAVLALEGLFQLMTQRNIDYPDFYMKLYSLLDDEILHSKHRSRFFRLLDKCLASSHLPVALVASFIKRLARLALQAPPGAVVWFVPWTYNLLKQHPTCTFMIHREEHPAHAMFSLFADHNVSGMDDPFDMEEPDPMLTKAIDSSLWEMPTLASHYHPNVATLASILGEQFTKREYQLEDFLDHSYATLLTAELERKLVKAPVVEWEIPKRIISADDESGGLNSLGIALESAIAVL